MFRSHSVEHGLIDLNTVLIPFFKTINTLKITNIPQVVLDNPLELVYNRDKSVKFSRNGRPVIKVNKELSKNAKLVSQYFLKSHTNC